MSITRNPVFNLNTHLTRSEDPSHVVPAWFEDLRPSLMYSIIHSNNEVWRGGGALRDFILAIIILSDALKGCSIRGDH
jgi:hypothetical protein